MRSMRQAMVAAATAAALAWGTWVGAAEAAAKSRRPVNGSTQVGRHLNGAVQSGIATAIPHTQLVASPVRIDAEWKPHPYLAESWKLSDDGKTLTLHLRKDALFHDGKRVASADVAFSIMAIKQNHPFQTMLAPVEKVDIPDPHTAVV